MKIETLVHRQTDRHCEGGRKRGRWALSPPDAWLCSISCICGVTQPTYSKPHSFQVSHLSCITNGWLQNQLKKMWGWKIEEKKTAFANEFMQKIAAEEQKGAVKAHSYIGGGYWNCLNYLNYWPSVQLHWAFHRTWLGTQHTCVCCITPPISSIKDKSVWVNWIMVLSRMHNKNIKISAVFSPPSPR